MQNFFLFTWAAVNPLPHPSPLVCFAHSLSRCAPSKCPNSVLLFVYVDTQYDVKWTSDWKLLKFPHKEITLDEVISSLAWAPLAFNFTSFKNTSSAQLSVVRIEQPRTQYCVGDTLNVLVEMRNHAGNPKAHGGDFILARIHSPKLQASASGDVTDFLNGTYRVHFHLFWPGEVHVSVQLLHSSEAVKILQRDWMYNYRTIIHTGTFISGKVMETNLCALRLSSDRPLCEYGKKEDGEYYACYRPQTLPCDSLTLMKASSYPGPRLTKEEASLFAPKNTGKEMKNSFQPLKVIGCTGEVQKPSEKCTAGMNSPFPGGYFYSNSWSSSVCQTGSFLSEDAITRCLKGKTLYLLGDSTVRQWTEYLEQKLTGLKLIEKDGNLRLAVDTHNNITVRWVRHSHPWDATYQVPIKGSVTTPEALDSIAVGGRQEDAIVVIGIGQHFRPFPPEVFIRRLLSIRHAILRLHARNPLANVAIKLENKKELKSSMIGFSDWNGYMQNIAQRKVFQDMKVALVDVWDMTVAMNSLPLHPNEVIVSNEVAVALSFFCH
ncbi:hypothetical protein GJAV_G00099940 [Gymnothorax javanicus]|nr:hypothetical protein GJAV_G00099940 [Gymnothorax javanicus]